MNEIINELNKTIEHDNLIIKELTEKNIELENRIEEAIELIDDWFFNVSGNGADMSEEDVFEIFKILKGDSNE